MSDRYLPLLSATLQHAVATVPYYAEAFAGRALELSELSELTRFPILTRATIAAQGVEMVSRERPPDFVRNTSGSTFGSLARNPLATFHVNEEGELWKRLMVNEALRDAQVRPLMLRFLTIDHGQDVAGGVPGVLPVPLVTPAHFAHVRDLLGRRFRFPGFTERVHGLIGTLTRIKLLTALCLRNGIDPDEFAIAFISSHSQLLTNRWRNTLRSYWGIEITEVYGLSEVPGLIGARCEHCGHYHLSPAAFIETVDPDSYQPVTTGLARLVATALYPLIQAQPLIRYDTEDLVEIMQPCPTTSQPALEYVGRASSAVRRGRQLLLSPMRLHDLLDDEPEIAVEPSQLATPFAIRDVGFLKYDFRATEQDGRLDVVLDVELRREPRLYPTDDAALRDRLHHRILAASPELAGVVDAGGAMLAITLHGPGTLRRLAEA